MTDKALDKTAVENAWQALAGHLAVTAGALAGLVSLLSDAPPHVAALRGAAAWVVLLFVSKLGFKALARALECERNEVQVDSKEQAN